MKRRLRVAAAAAVVAVVLLAYAGLVHTPAGPRSLAAFDPDRLAELELEMWKAWGSRENNFAEPRASMRRKGKERRPRILPRM